MSPPPPHQPRLATPAQVRERLGLDEADPPDAVLAGFIEDQQAVVERRLRRTFAPDDASFSLASSATVDLAASICLLRQVSIAGDGADVRLGKFASSRRAQQDALLRLSRELRASAEQALLLLERDARVSRFMAIRGGR